MSRQNKRQATKHTEGPRVPAWVWLFTGGILGAFIMFLLHLSEMQGSPSQEQKPATAKTNTKEKQKPRFDFYDLLKENQVSTPEYKTQEKKDPSKIPQQRMEFLLQVASFKSQEDAEQLRAELILLNLEAYTEQAKIRSGETWHRVIVGPFTSKSKLSKARSILLTNRHEALVLKRQPQS